MSQNTPLTTADLPTLRFPRRSNAAGVQWGPGKFNFWYDHIIDMMLANPKVTNADIARSTGRTANWISMVKNSDAFRARYAQRRDEVTTLLNDTIGEKLGLVASKGLDILLEKMNKVGGNVTLEEAVDLNDKVLARLGYGTRQGPAPASVNVNVNASAVAGAQAAPLPLDAFRSAQESLRMVEEARARGLLKGPTTIEAKVEPTQTDTLPEARRTALAALADV